MARRMMNEILQRGQGAASAVHILQHHGSPFRKLCTTHRVASKHQRGAQDHRVTGPFCSTLGMTIQQRLAELKDVDSSWSPDILGIILVGYQVCDLESLL